MAARHARALGPSPAWPAPRSGSPSPPAARGGAGRARTGRPCWPQWRGSQTRAHCRGREGGGQPRAPGLQLATHLQRPCLPARHVLAQQRHAGSASCKPPANTHQRPPVREAGVEELEESGHVAEARRRGAAAPRHAGPQHVDPQRLARQQLGRHALQAQAAAVVGQPSQQLFPGQQRLPGHAQPRLQAGAEGEGAHPVGGGVGAPQPAAGMGCGGKYAQEPGDAALKKTQGARCPRPCRLERRRVPTHRQRGRLGGWLGAPRRVWRTRTKSCMPTEAGASAEQGAGASKPACGAMQLCWRRHGPGGKGGKGSGAPLAQRLAPLRAQCVATNWRVLGTPLAGPTCDSNLGHGSPGCTKLRPAVSIAASTKEPASRSSGGRAGRCGCPPLSSERCGLAVMFDRRPAYA